MAEAANPATINLVVKDQNQHEIQFRVKATTKFKKIFEAYCTKKGLAVGSLKFVVDGERLHEDQSPADFDMEDGDSIDVFQEQIGGSGC